MTKASETLNYAVESAFKGIIDFAVESGNVDKDITFQQVKTILHKVNQEDKTGLDEQQLKLYESFRLLVILFAVIDAVDDGYFQKG